MLYLTVAVQWLHILAGLTWFGGQLFTYAVIWPALLRRPAEARAVSRALEGPAMRVMGPAGGLVFLLGIIRGTVLGPVRSLAALGTPYGLTFLAAIVLTFFLMGYGGSIQKQMETRVWSGEAFAPGAAAWLRMTGTVQMLGLAAILACMVLMRFGL